MEAPHQARTAAGRRLATKSFLGPLKWIGFFEERLTSGDHFRAYFLRILRVWHTNLSAGRRFNRPLCSFVSICFHTLVAKFLVLLLRGHCEQWPLFILTIKTSVFQANSFPGCFCRMNIFDLYFFPSTAAENPFCCEEIMQMQKPHLSHGEECFTRTQNAMWANCN